MKSDTDDLGYPDLSDELFRQLADLLFKQSGITLKDHKKYLVLHRLSKFVGPYQKFHSFEQYYEGLLKDTSGELLIEFVNVLTTNWTFFFREPLHFDFLSGVLKKIKETEGTIRLWSAACSSGEEPYSMAITALRTIPDIHLHDFKILATDISQRVLNFAKSGIYHFNKVRGHLADDELRTYFQFDQKNNDFVVKPTVRELITYRYLNLLEPLPFSKKFDIVFLRNVLIYFDNREKEIVINKISKYIKPGVT